MPKVSPRFRNMLLKLKREVEETESRPRYYGSPAGSGLPQMLTYHGDKEATAELWEALDAYYAKNLPLEGKKLDDFYSALRVYQDDPSALVGSTRDFKEEHHENMTPKQARSAIVNGMRIGPRMPIDLDLYRGVGEEGGGTLKPRYPRLGVLSTSLDPELARQFAGTNYDGTIRRHGLVDADKIKTAPGGKVLELTAPEGFPMIPVGQGGEAELIIPKSRVIKNPDGTYRLIPPYKKRGGLIKGTLMGARRG